MIILINLSSYQSAIYEELSKLGFNVYDEVTENAKFPYVVIGDLEFEEAEYHFNDLIDINLYILIWSIWEGKKEVNDIASNIINAFTLLKEKQVNNQSLYNFSLGNSSIKRLDGGIYNGSLALNFTVKQI